MGKIEVPIVIKNGEAWLILNNLSSSGKIRAAFIGKKEHVHDWDMHHCEEVQLKTSIRYHPKKYQVPELITQ